jgi:hypothetical protein
MKRSLRNWLASLIVLAAPSATYAQNFIGDSHLAPVALEARCRVADGMLDSWSRYRNLGSDPLHVALSSPKKLEVTPVLTGKIPFQASPAFCPMALEFDSDLCELEQQQAEQVALAALAGIAADEPIDVDRHEPAISLSKDVDGRSVANAANRLVGSSPMIVVLEEVAVEEVAVDACMACYPWPNLDSALDEEYLPYDLPVAKREAVDEVTSQAVVARISPIDESLGHPITVDFANLGGAEKNISESMGLSYCVPVAESVEDIDLLATDSTPLVESQHVPQLMVGDYYPDDQQLRELDRMARAMQYSVPIDCLVHDWIWRGGEMMASDGPIVAWMNGDRIGQEIGTLASEAFEAIVENSLPVLPILARPIEVNVPAPQQIAAPHGRADELAIAGSVLISIADELDAFASSIRSLGSSIHQAAAQNRAILR